MANNSKNNFHNTKKVQNRPKPSFVSAAPEKAAKEKKLTPLSNKEALITTIVSLVLFVALAAYELIINNSDTLFMVQSRSMFTYGCEFFQEMTKAPGALVAWLGCYFTQFFYYPALGASILIGLWCILFFIIKKAYRISNIWSVVILIPLALLLVSTIYNGYWIYYLKHAGYWFRETFGFIYAASTVLAVSRLNKYYIPRAILSVLLITVGYYYFGYYALVAGIAIIVNEWCNIKNQSVMSAGVVSILSAVATIMTPFICYNSFFTEIRHQDIFLAGFPLFQQDKFYDYPHSYPFVIISVIMVLLPLFSLIRKDFTIPGKYKNLYRLALVIFLAGTAWFVDRQDFKDYNYHVEMRMYDAVENNRWDEVLSESGDYTRYSYEQRQAGKEEVHPTREMVIFTHLALLNKGEMGNQMFKYNNFGASPYVPDTTFAVRTKANDKGVLEPELDEDGKQIVDTLCLKVHMVQTAGPLIYYQHAKTNFASRWCIENSVEFGYTFNDCKMLVRCALINEEWDVAKKYIEILKQSIYYKDWAEKYEPIIKNHDIIKKFHEFDNIRELYTHMGTVLDGDQGLCEMYLLNYFGHTMNKDSKLLQELTLNYALINKDIQLFWPRFFLYAQLHKGEQMPVHYQEAAYLYGNLERAVDISGMPFKDEVKQRYASFQQVSQNYLKNGMTQEQVRDLMEPMFGDTFYWFYFFCRDVRSY